LGHPGLKPGAGKENCDVDTTKARLRRAPYVDAKRGVRGESAEGGLWP